MRPPVHRRSVPRLSVVLLAALLLGGCGFQLQPEARLPAQMEQTLIVAQAPYSHFVRRLTILLEQNGARVMEGPPATALLEIPVNEARKDILSIGDTARVREFRVVHRVTFRLLDADGAVLVPEQTIERARVISFSELQAEVLERLGVSPERLAVIPNGVDPQLWCPAETQPSAALSELRERFRGKRVFLYMGRLSTEKNVEALLKAWRLVRPDGCVLVIVGDGPLLGSLQAGREEPDVIWWGYESRLEVRVALQQIAEVFLLPSLVEGLSLALLEAMASGTACVATDAGADGEVLEGGAGIVMRTQGVTTQLRTLLPVLRDQPVLTAELGLRARRRVLARYTLTNNIDAVEQLYAEVLAAEQVPLSRAANSGNSRQRPRVG